ncbi:MAG: hypothetical protein NVS4B3_11430 [Gemmatimonadaceae bacterium]
MTGRARRDAKRRLLAYPLPLHTSRPRQREGTHPADLAWVDALMGAHRRYNAEHFGGALADLPIRVSRRMRSRLGHYTARGRDGELAEIAISASHLSAHGMTEALHTLLHEMVHQWQDETGRPLDHGSTFRAKADQVGIAPVARRNLRILRARTRSA